VPVQAGVRGAKRGATTNITYYLSTATHRRLKRFGLDNDMTLQAIIDEALDEYFEGRGLPRLERIVGRKYRKNG
jgi:hypothetical protein